MGYTYFPVEIPEKQVIESSDCQIIASAVSDRTFMLRTPENKIIVIDGGFRQEIWDDFNHEILIEKLMQNNTYKNVVLGCTHYELVSKIFEKVCPNINFIKPCERFSEVAKITYNTNSKAGDILMLASLPTKSYIDKLWKIFNS